MNINPGELNKKIQIICMEDRGRNENGFPLSPGERIVRSCYAKVSNISGTEIMKANSEFAETKRRFLIRYGRKEINTDMIIRYAGKDYDIKYVNTYGDDREYTEIWTDREERA